MNNNNFFISELGRWVITGICAVIIWGLMLFFLLGIESQMAASIVSVICAFFGWRALNRIQPVSFFGMSLAGWVTYFTIKLILSVLIGVFITPFSLGKIIANMITNRS